MRKTKSRTAAALRRAVNLLVRVGWTRGLYRALSCEGETCDGNCKVVGYCSVGAIEGATRSLRIRNLARSALHVSISTSRKPPPLHLGGITHWNDSRRSLREVLPTFRRAIKIAEEKYS